MPFNNGSPNPYFANGFTNICTMEVDPNVEIDDFPNMEGMDILVSPLLNAIPRLDEAMSFAEMLKFVLVAVYALSMVATERSSFLE